MENIILTPKNSDDFVDEIIVGLYNKICNNGIISKTESKELLTISEASDFLTLTKKTIYSKVHKREIPHLKRAGRLYFKKSDLINWLEEGRVKTKEEIEETAYKSLTKHNSIK